jgi:hypothetical protein
VLTRERSVGGSSGRSSEAIVDDVEREESARRRGSGGPRPSSGAVRGRDDSRAVMSPKESTVLILSDLGEPRESLDGALERRMEPLKL